jgi:hypothetical protein
VKFIPVSIAVNINSERDFAPIQLEQNSSLIRRRPSGTSQSYCAPIPMCRSTSLAAIPGSRIIVRGKPPSKPRKGRAGGSNCVPRAAGGRTARFGPIRPPKPFRREA